MIDSKVSRLLRQIADKENVPLNQVELIYKFLWKSTADVIKKKSHEKINLFPLGSYQLNREKEMKLFEEVVFKKDREEYERKREEAKIVKKPDNVIYMSFSELKKVSND